MYSLGFIKKDIFFQPIYFTQYFFNKLKLKLLVQFWLTIETIWWRNWESNIESDNGNCRKPNLHFHQWKLLNRLCGLSVPIKVPIKFEDIQETFNIGLISRPFKQQYYNSLKNMEIVQLCLNMCETQQYNIIKIFNISIYIKYINGHFQISFLYI